MTITSDFYLTSIQKPDFRHTKNSKRQKKSVIQKKIPSDLVIKLLILFVIKNILWLISANRCLKKISLVNSSSWNVEKYKSTKVEKEENLKSRKLLLAIFWILLATFVYFFILLATFGYFWILLATFGYCWLLLATVTSFWLLVATFDYSWILLDNFANFWLILATFGYSWLLLASVGYFWLLLALFGYVWLLLATISYCWPLLAHLANFGYF